MANKLPVHERLITLLGIGLLIVLTLITQFRRPPEIPQLSPKENVEIEVVVKGAVKKTTVIKVKRGTRFEEVVAQVPLLPEANADRVGRKILKKEGQIVHIPKKRKKT